MNFCWVSINVLNMEKSLQFYQDLLELKINRRMKPNQDMEIIFLGSGETQVELIWNVENKVVDFGKDITLGFTVNSIEEIQRVLKEKKIPIHSGPFQPNPFVKFIYVQDPNGLKIQLVENIK